MIDILSSILYLAHTYLQIYSFYDCVEILFFITVTFKISLWLNKDHTKPLLLYFYSYFAILLTSYFAQLPTVYQVMLITAPIYFVLLLVHHQKNLQKNFILSQNKPVTPATSLMYKEWLEILMRSCLKALHQNKSITCVIEQYDTLETLLNKPFIIDIPIQKQIIDMLFESVSYDINKLIAINRHGNILSINASWSDLIINELVFTAICQRQLPLEYAKIVTSKTDAIIIHINAEDQNHFVAHQGKIITELTIDQTLKLVKNLLYKKDKESFTQGIYHDSSKSTSISTIYKD